MARPRTIDDGELVNAAGEQLASGGMARFTLQAVADRAGVSAATLVKRFGSKHGLLVAVDRRWIASIPADLAELAASHEHPVDRLRAAALWGFDDMDDPVVARNLVTALAADLEDDELRTLLAAGWSALRSGLEGFVRQAAADLPSAPPPEQAARILFALTEGTRLSWSVDPAGSLLARAEADVDALLAIWRSPPRR